MKQHKDKDVWARRPDALPLPDAPSTGARRKKGVARLWSLLLSLLLGLSLLANAIGYFAALQARKAGLEGQKRQDDMELHIRMLTVQNAVLRSKVNGCGELFDFDRGGRVRT